jgi:hypothetical protein
MRSVVVCGVCTQYDESFLTNLMQRSKGCIEFPLVSFPISWPYCSTLPCHQPGLRRVFVFISTVYFSESTKLLLSCQCNQRLVSTHKRSRSDTLLLAEPRIIIPVLFRLNCCFKSAVRNLIGLSIRLQIKGRKISTSTQLCEILYTDSQHMLLLSSTVASR